MVIVIGINVAEPNYYRLSVVIGRDEKVREKPKELRELKGHASDYILRVISNYVCAELYLIWVVVCF